MATAPTVSAIRAAIKTALDGIAGPLPGGGAGKVHNRARHSISDTDNATDFLDSDSVIRATFISMVTPNPEEEDEARYKYWVKWKFQIEHLRHFDDQAGSETLFMDELEKIKNTLRASASIFAVPERDTERVVQIETLEMSLWTGRLVHRGLLALEVEASEVIAP